MSAALHAGSGKTTLLRIIAGLECPDGGRILAVEPRVLLLDEPFGALDAKVRKELRVWLRKLHDEVRVTSVFVTHDQEEALELADRVVVMNEGRIEQVGRPRDIRERPATDFVSDFVATAALA